LQEKIQGKSGGESEERAAKWIEELTGEDVYDFYEALKSGIILCKLINKIKPNTIQKINELPTTLHQRDNIKLYLTSCEQLGLSPLDLFHISDLHDGRNINLVAQNIYALSRMAQFVPGYTGPLIEGTKRAEGKKPELRRNKTENFVPALKRSDSYKPPAPQGTLSLSGNMEYKGSSPEIKLLQEMQKEKEKEKEKGKELENLKNEVIQLKKTNEIGQRKI